MENVDISFDKEFEKIDGLKWLPYVGKNYKNNKHKIVVVLESLYQNPGNESTKCNDCVRKCVEEEFIKKEWQIYYPKFKTYQRINQMLTGNVKPEVLQNKKLWSNLVFSELVQAVIPNIEKRPLPEDFKKGWHILGDIIQILEPTAMIFIGKTAAYYSGHKLVNDSKINGTYAVKPIKINNKITAVFTKHSSKMFSWEKWRQHLEKHISDEMKFLSQ